ncbi:hypothetical protein, partial [Rhizobium leguminosarum]|uniref:hypothetical protein n=1 Tax=Rhizobium leguminosarum TaxID=384 RepID=UPI003F962904
DEHGLGWFDGTALYEHEYPRKGFHPDCSTAIYNFGRFEVLVDAIFVRDPIAVLARIIEVENRSDGIDTQTVEVEFFGPVERVVNEIGNDLG